MFLCCLDSAKSLLYIDMYLHERPLKIKRGRILLCPYEASNCTSSCEITA